MTVCIVLLRGVNVGSGNRIAMPALRAALASAGIAGARTYLQSGNVVLDTGAAPAPSDPPNDPPRDPPSADFGNPVRTVRTALPNPVEEAVHAVLLSEFGVDVPVISRTLEEPTDVIARNPFPEQALESPKALQVTFLSEPADPSRVAGLAALARGGELIAGSGRELYSWHPDGIAGSRMALALTPKGAAATARNWATVTALHRMATDAD